LAVCSEQFAAEGTGRRIQVFKGLAVEDRHDGGSRFPRPRAMNGYCRIC